MALKREREGISRSKRETYLRGGLIDDLWYALYLGREIASHNVCTYILQFQLFHS